MAGSRLGFGLGEMLSRADLNDAAVTGEQQQVKIVNSEDLKDDSLVKLPIGVLDPGKYQPSAISPVFEVIQPSILIMIFDVVITKEKMSF